MGQTGSNVAKRLWSPFGSYDSTTKDDSSLEERGNTCITRYVFMRTGSMFFNEEGDLAHEFYEETRTSKGTTRMKRKLKHLTPQGEVKLSHPRLHGDFPVILYDTRQR